MATRTPKVTQFMSQTRPLTFLERLKLDLKTALYPRVVRRALMYAVCVGAILITINHGDALVRAEVDRTRLLKMLLTVMVPYLVSTLSSVGAIRELSRSDQT
jgi:hypothetical protein